MKRPVFDPQWGDEIKALYRHDMQEIWDPALAPQIFSQYHNQLALYRALVDDVAKGARLRILDVGCAQGTLALLLAEAGHSVAALDLRPDFLDYARTRHERGDITFIAGNALEIELGGPFDVIFANQIVEHLVYPDVLLARLRALLSPCGLLVVTTPNWSYVKNSFPSFEALGDVRQYEGKQFTADGDGHFFFYKATELARLFRDAGLRDVETRFFETPFICGHMKLRYLHGRLPYSVLRALDRMLLAVPVLREKLAHQLLVSGRNDG